MLLNYQQSGQGSHVVLIHGLFGSLENLNVIAKALSENYTVTNIDLRNHGKSFHSDSMNYTVMAADVLELLNHLNINKAHIVGHSMGGKVAMQLALSYPERVEKLVVMDISPVANKPRHGAIFKGLNDVANSAVTDRKAADEILAKQIPELGVRQFLLKSFAKNEQGQYQWRFNLAVLDQQYENILAQLDENDSCLCDTLFIKGNDSDYILAEHRPVIMALFPNSKAKIIHGAGHWLHAQKPLAVNKAISDFLASN
ncbi:MULTISPECIES: alpha/beta fold hydrolase [Pseudoalteromonas]|jgi:esterase|uniref:alpha/beta fold hydrolase n=1 Tax=Pseudoalteromonas TaxID=53246 RepID=UPI000826E06B|nr:MULTISPECIES: alpha/beta fold hydrolase [Pseudoalteromonas]QMW13125.1 alpha/beta fold hydrolase [Pseudoalteromonas sp. MT33b]QPL41520.1 alpha/beta fold hydrolase [Pseudoalteromonas sp. A41-2]|tara:strand:- start:127 stop:894 length:768 start_codon:yes stop_codon:yes gene_type:complete